MANCKQMLMGGQNAAYQVRDERIDSIKYWLIVLVIAGHVFGRPQFSNDISCVVTWKWIYIFHMPLFIFISGYFSQKKDKKYLWPSIWKLLEPLIVFQVLTLLPRFIVNGFSFVAILTPWYVLWYLLSLIYWRLMIQIIPDKILKNAKLILIVTFCISILAGFLPFNRFLSIQRTLSFMPFFFLGYYMKDKNIYLLDRYKPLGFLFLISMIAIPLFFHQFLGDLMHADSYENDYEALKRIFTFFLAIPMSIAFISICPNIRWSAKQGKYTLQYYIYHALAITPIMTLITKLNIPTTYISASIITLIILIGMGVASFSSNFTKFVTISSFIKKGKK